MPQLGAVGGSGDVAFWERGGWGVLGWIDDNYWRLASPGWRRRGGWGVLGWIDDNYWRPVSPGCERPQAEACAHAQRGRHCSSLGVTAPKGA